MSREWTLRQTLFCLIGSTLLTLTLSLSGWHFWKQYKRERLQSKSYQIQAIIQTGPEKEALQTAYLAELLGLSSDQPMPLYAFDVKKGEEKLLSSPLIASAAIQKWPPNTLYIDYEVRKPIAWLADFKNIAVDEEGYYFPVAPFLTPKKLPEIYLGLSSLGPEKKIEGSLFRLSLEILHYLETVPWTEGFRVQQIDVSHAEAPSLGTREVVLWTEEEISLPKESGEMVCTFPKILRLGVKDYAVQLNHFFNLRRTMMEDYKRQLSDLKTGGRFAPRIIDLRLSQLAFVEK